MLLSLLVILHLSHLLDILHVTLPLEHLLVLVPLIRGGLHVLVILLLEQMVSVGNQWFVLAKEWHLRTGCDDILVVP